MISLLVFFLLFLLPFLIAPFGTTNFETPKVILAEVVIVVLCFIVLLRKQKKVSKNNSRVFFSGAIILLTIIHLIFFRTPLSFFGNEFRLQGIFLLWLLLLFSYLSSKVDLKKISWVIFLLLIFAQAIATVMLPVNESNRSVGTLGEPNASAAFLLFLWPFLWFSLPKEKTRQLIILSLGFLCVALVFYCTQSRSALIGFALQVFLLILLRVKIQIKQAVIICLCLLFASFSLPFFEKNVLYENRGEVWTAAAYAGLSHPIIGGGFGNTELLLHQAAQEQHFRIRKYYVDSAHNIFFDWWVQGGLVGVTVFCFLLFSVFKTFVAKKHIRNLVLVLGLLAALSFNPASVVGLLQLWWLIGLGLVGNNEVGNR